MQVLCLYGPRKYKPKLKSEIRKHQYTRSRSLANAKIYMLLNSFCFVYLKFEGNFRVQVPGACVWRGDLSEGFLRYEFGWLIFGEAYCRNFTVFK